MVSALHDVNLLDFVRAICKDEDANYNRPYLDLEMKADLFSHGQKQLFCIARALIQRHKRGRILLIDEATSGLDYQTDSLIQSIIRERFADHTIIAVAHRIETIMDFDRVAVFHDGRMVEFDEPGQLKEKEGSMFKRLYDARLGTL